MTSQRIVFIGKCDAQSNVHPTGELVLLLKK